MQNVPYNDYHPNTCILDLSATAKTLHSFNSGIYPVQIADLCSIIEAIVLNDHILIVGNWQGFPEAYKDILIPYLKKNIFTIAPITQKSFRPDQSVNVNIQLAKNAVAQKLTKSSIEDAGYETTRLLNAEAELKAPAVALLRHLHNRCYFLKPNLEHHICDLYNCTRELNDIIFETKKTDFFKTPHALPYREIPPIAFEVFKITKTYDQLIDSIEQIREKFSPLRKHLFNEWEVMKAPSTPVSISREKLAKLEKEWRTLVSKSKCIKISQGITSTKLLATGAKTVGWMTKNAFGTVDTDESVDLFSEILGLVPDAIEAFKPNSFRLISKPVNSYLATSGPEIYTHLSRIFEENPDHIAELINKLAYDKSNIYHQQSHTKQIKAG